MHVSESQFKRGRHPVCIEQPRHNSMATTAYDGGILRVSKCEDKQDLAAARDGASTSE